MKVRFLRDAGGYRSGETADIPDDLAIRWAFRGFVEQMVPKEWGRAARLAEERDKRKPRKRRR